MCCFVMNFGFLMQIWSSYSSVPAPCDCYLSPACFLSAWLRSINCPVGGEQVPPPPFHPRGSCSSPTDGGGRRRPLCYLHELVASCQIRAPQPRLKVSAPGFSIIGGMCVCAHPSWWRGVSCQPENNTSGGVEC